MANMLLLSNNYDNSFCCDTHTKTVSLAREKKRDRCEMSSHQSHPWPSSMMQSKLSFVKKYPDIPRCAAAATVAAEDRIAASAGA